jgi:hypothetical protein
MSRDFNGTDAGMQGCSKKFIVAPCFQLGLPMDRAQYIHRLGRTARAGRRGKGILLLSDTEKRFLASLSGLPLSEAQALPEDLIARAKATVERGLAAVDYQSKAQVKTVSLFVHDYLGAVGSITPVVVALACMPQHILFVRHALYTQDPLLKAVWVVNCRRTGLGWGSTRAL